jgi:hypothetical protein
MNVEEIRAEFERWTFRMPGYSWTLRLDDLDVAVAFPVTREPSAVLQITVTTQDSTGQHVDTGGTFNVVHTYQRPVWMFPDGEFFGHWLRECITRTVEHEAMEWLRRDDVAVFDPHRVPR